MRAYVFPDASLRPYASQLVWLSLDTERAGNAPVVEKLAVHVLPTMFVVDSASEATLAEWAGSRTAAELAKLLAETLGAAAPDEAGAALRRARRAEGEARDQEAIDQYRAALAAAPAGWAARDETLDALVTKLGDGKQSLGCATTAVEAAPTMAPGTALAYDLRAGI
jgi:hypothetical protein